MNAKSGSSGKSPIRSVHGRDEGEQAVKLFINYRRDDTDDFAGRLYERLISEFGTDNIFKDVDSIRPGQNWRAVLQESVGSCDVVLALIGKHWCACADAKGQRRLMSEDDWVRFELEAAYRTRRVIMPVIVKGAPIPRIDELPESLQWLPEIHVSEVRGDPFFKDDAARLVNELRRMRERLIEHAQVAAQVAAAPSSSFDSAAAAGMVACPSCRRNCPRLDQFCEFCGATLWATCPRCSASVAASQRFCKSCGADVPRAKQAEEVFQQLRARVSQVGLNPDAMARFERCVAILADVEAAARTAADYPQLGELRRQIQGMGCDSAGEAATIAFANGSFGQALRFYRHLDVSGAANSEAIERIAFIQNHRVQKLNEAKSLMSTGRHQQAAALLEPLRTAFADDAQISEAFMLCRQILDRATTFLHSGLRGLQARHRLIELESEIRWLESQKIRASKLPDLAAAIREKIASANATVAEAAAELRAGNIKGARQMAMAVLANIADHAEAMEVARSAGTVNERIAQLEEYVNLEHWCAAKDLMGELRQAMGPDPTLARLKARIDTAIGNIDFNIRLFAIMTVTAVAGWFMIPWFASLSENATVVFRLGWGFVWIFVLPTAWWVFPNKGQTLRRAFSYVRKHRPRLIDQADVAYEGKRVQDAGLGSSGSQPRIEVGADWLASVAKIVTAPVDSTTTTVAPNPTPMATATAKESPPEVIELPEDFNATRSIQRIESTAIAVEWLVLGGFAFWLAEVISNWLTRHGLEGAWAVPVRFAAIAFAVAAAALYVRAFSAWRFDVVAAAVYTLLVGGLALVAASETTALIAGCFLPAYLGVISARVDRKSMWRGVGAFLAASLGGSLVAIPAVVGFAVLANYVAPSKAWWDSTGASLACAAFAWCSLVALGSTASGTLVRYFVVNRALVRSIFALGFVFAIAAATFCAATGLGNLFNDKSLWIIEWVLLLVISQVVPPLLRWQWRPWLSIFSATACAATIAITLLFEWLEPASPVLIAVWVVFHAAFTLPNVDTVDIFANQAEVWTRIRGRLRMRRLPVRINISRS
jgi:tetratricopeptide (TPR) repeat protein